MGQTLRTAALSPCGRYRWWLERLWEPRRPRLLFIGLNPSRADGRRDDATLRRLLGFADRWGFGALEVLNLFARISPSPALLQRAADPVGPANDAWIRARLAASPEAPLWLGWGQRGGWRQRDRQVGPLLEGRRCLALGRGAAGQPRHPLYLPADAQPEAWIWRQPLRLGHPEGGSAPVAASPPCRALPVAMRFTCT